MPESVNYIPLLISIVFAILVPVVLVIGDYLLGPKVESSRKATTYECGFILDKKKDFYDERVFIRFILVALLFILFDVEVAFIFPWALMFKTLNIQGLVEMLIFTMVLVFGLFYAYKKGAFKWD